MNAAKKLSFKLDFDRNAAVTMMILYLLVITELFSSIHYLVSSKLPTVLNFCFKGSLLF